MTDIADRFKKLHSDVINQDYYLHLWHRTLTQFDMQDHRFHQFSDERLVRAANSFWERLPDSRAIRRHPFFDLCYICEYDYR